MYVESIRLRQFRNISSATLNFGPRFTILYGVNGSGKTNVLEALYFASTLKSFRGADLATMVQHGESRSEIEVRIQPQEEPLPVDLKVVIQSGEKTSRRVSSVNGKLVRSGRQFYGRLSAILFTPDDLNILRGAPQQRRNFLDRVIFARENAHISDVQQYDKLLRSRNRLLKQEFQQQNKVETQMLLESYETGLARFGAQIWSRRLETLRQLLDQFNRTYIQIDQASSTGQMVKFVYDSKVQKKLPPKYRVAGLDVQPNPGASESLLLERLAASRSEDFRRKTTSIGPHLDDWMIELNGHHAAHFASQGQARALILAFKVAELRRAQEDCGNPPILLLDDVSSELDPQRSAQLFNVLADEVDQCVITTTAVHHIPYNGENLRKNVHISSGTLTFESPLNAEK